MKVINIEIIEPQKEENYNHVPGNCQGDITLCIEDYAGDNDRIIKINEGMTVE